MFRIPLAILTIILASQTAYGSETAVPLKELFFTSRDFSENVDSPATWLGPDGQRWLISTCKGTHNLRIEDAGNGALIRTFGGQGSGPAQFDRPNGVFVIDDLLLVVERDNRRVQVLHLPSLKSLTSFGQDVLRKPYGLFVHKLRPGEYTVYVTDDFEDPAIPLSERVKMFGLEVEGIEPDTAEGDFLRAFGQQEGPGRLDVVESIWGDPENNRLLIAEEYAGDGNQAVLVYSMDGSFTGKQLGLGRFKGQPEGIALFEAPDGGGFWILTDQGKTVNQFLLFDRRTLDYIGAFKGRTTLNTDGIWLEQRPLLPRYPKGLFFAVHNDGNVAAFDWAEVLHAFPAP